MGFSVVEIDGSHCLHFGSDHPVPFSFPKQGDFFPSASLWRMS